MEAKTKLKRTPLYQSHIDLGGKMVDFAGWEMPVQYSTLLEEHLAVRNNCGIFDISHMGQVIVSGASSQKFLNYLLTNDVSKLNVGDAQYTLMCNEQGGIIDDLYVYYIEDDKYLLVINASRTDVDLSHLLYVLNSFPEKSKVCIDFLKNAGAVAVQGPKAVDVIQAIINSPSIDGTRVNTPLELKKNQVGKFNFNGEPIYVSRTGYTGEDGFELFASGKSIVQFWKQVFGQRERFQIKPAGLGARDTLRLEACYPLYGNELDEQTTAFEAGLKIFVSLNKGEFLGREALMKATEIKRRCVAFKMIEKTPPPRHGYYVWADTAQDKPIGAVTSGTHSPILEIGIGMAYVLTEFSQVGTKINIEIRGKKFPAEVVKKPFYKKS